MANTYKQNIGGTVTKVSYDKTNTSVDARSSSKIYTKQVRAAGANTSLAHAKLVAAKPGETIVRVKAIGNDGANCMMGLKDVNGTVIVGTQDVSGVFNSWEPVEDADEIVGNFSEVSVTGDNTQATYAICWISQ